MQITLYTTPNCPQCRVTKKMLDEAKVEYQLIDLSEDVKAMNMVKELGYSAAPVVVVGDRHWSGFRHDKVVSIISSYRTMKMQEAA